LTLRPYSKNRDIPRRRTKIKTPPAESLYQNPLIRRGFSRLGAFPTPYIIEFSEPQ